MISWHSFYDAAVKLLKTSEAICGGWTIQSVSDADGSQYLVFRQTRSSLELEAAVLTTNHSGSLLLANHILEKSAEVLLDEVDTGILDRSASDCLLQFEYHVVYNEAFSVPQLYFTVTSSDGSLVPLPRLQCLIPHSLLIRDSSEHADQVWKTLTQTEHPLLHRPFYTLHPCQTEDFIAKIQEFSKNWLISWLSSVGPAVGLHMSTEYASTEP